MARALLRGAFFACLCMSAANAQITITESDYRALVGGNFRSTIHVMDAQQHSQLADLIGATGADRTYDFSPFTFGSVIPASFDVLASTAGTPAASSTRYGSVNFVRHSTIAGPYGGTSHAYQELRSDGLMLLGNSMIQAVDYDANGILDTSFQHIEPYDRNPLPMAIGTSWSQTFVGTSIGMGTTSTFTIAEEGTVEGWGTLITPAGTEPALRVRRVRTTTTAGVPPIATTFIELRTKSLHTASIVLNSDGLVINATYSDGARSSGVADRSGWTQRLHDCVPNPADNTASLDVEITAPGRATLSVIDLHGVEVARPLDDHLSPGRYSARIATSNLPNGQYICRLDVNGVRSVRRLVVYR